MRTGVDGRIGQATYEGMMMENLNKTEARQGDRRRTNKTAVLIGTPLAFILMGILFLIWA